MKVEDFEKLKQLIGKKVVKVLASDDEKDHGFELVFDDGTVLEVYNLRCSKLDSECVIKKVRIRNLETNELKRTANVPIGGGVAWVVSKEEVIR